MALEFTRLLARPGKLERGLGLSCVEAILEVAPDRLATRKHVFVADAAWGEGDDADVLVTVAVAACVRRSFVESSQAVALSLSPHIGDLPEGGEK